jgi:hypothetical protein
MSTGPSGQPAIIETTGPAFDEAILEASCEDIEWAMISTFSLLS